LTLGETILPTTSIDTFFACTLIVSVAIIATAFIAETMQTQINSMQNLNKQDYLRNIADHIVTSCGEPPNWGSTNNPPTSFGLSTNYNDRLYELDVDKITRLNSSNEFALSYPSAFIAARLNNIALGVSVSQMLDLNIKLLQNSTLINSTEYTFQISVNQDAKPVTANLNCYIVATNFLDTASNSTSNSGVGQITIGIPNSSNGSSTLVAFARATFDERITAFAVFSFEHLSINSQPIPPFASLSPLNNTLNVHTNYPNTIIENIYAFTYKYQSNLNLTSNNTCAIPPFIDKSPTVLIVHGSSDTTQFNEWTTYPQVPLSFGADFSHSEINAFVYPVIINDALYKLTLLFGDVVN